ncbi:MAG: MmgE/PrpD family protein, partial [Dehalococcoidales bacterium]|nr:MmgE/PrpD family protein [Dehalococcoidales bacterium]
MNTTEALAKYVVDTSWEDIPVEVRERGKELLLDTIGAGLVGSLTATGKIVIDYVNSCKGAAEATVIGGGRIPAAYAALANGTLSHAPELESVALSGGPCPAIAQAAVVAVGEKVKASGRDVLEAFLLGYEMQGRVYAAIAPEVSSRGWNLATVCGVLGATAACGKLLKLDKEQLRNALGIAASQSSGLLQQAETMTHFYEFGVYARNGVEAALLAKLGMTGMKDSIENKYGLCAVLFGQGGYDLAKMTAAIGNPYQIVSPGVHTKKYTCCFRTHRALDAVLALMSENRIACDQVADIEVGINDYDAYLLKVDIPTCGENGRFSMRHCVASALLEGKVGWQSFTDEAVASAKYVEAREKVRVVHHPEWPKSRFESRTPVTMKLKNGQTYSREFSRPINQTRDELVASFKERAASV